MPWTDILVNAVGSFLGGLALLWLAMGSDGIRSLRSRFERPSVRIERKRTPRNIFTAIELGAPGDWVKQQLGPPTRVGERWWGYRFSDSLVCLSFTPEGSLQTVALGVTDKSVTRDFPTWHFDCPPLGRITLNDLVNAEHLELEYFSSLRHRELRLSGREGPTGAWHYIAFGALDPNFPGSLVTSEFEWDEQKSVLVSRSADVMVNWAALSLTPAIQGIPWDFAIPP